MQDFEAQSSLIRTLEGMYVSGCILYGPNLEMLLNMEVIVIYILSLLPYFFSLIFLRLPPVYATECYISFAKGGSYFDSLLGDFCA